MSREPSSESFAENYALAGVDITAGYESVKLMKKHIARTATAGVVNDIGDFGGLFMPDLTGMQHPIFVAGTDGVGTKLKLAFLLDQHNTVGQDAVAMCVNDIICCGAKPLFFLDYIACGKNYPDKIAAIVEGVAEGCVQADCALIGGETAEHPGMMPEQEYDIAGFAVGVVDRSGLLRPETQTVGDVLIGLASSGVHSNGFSLIRRIFPMEWKYLNVHVDELSGATLGETLLTPTTIYVRPILALLAQVPVKAIAHITGGGFYENIPRSLPQGITARIDRQAIRVLPIFDLIAKIGDIPEREMFNVFNMGVGMTVAVAPQDVETALESLQQAGVSAYVIGELVQGEEGVIIA